MNNTVKNALIFVVGAAIGSVTTWYFVKDKYKKIADEEIESVKEYYSNRKPKEETNPENSPVEKNEETIQERKEHMNEYKKLVSDKKYKKYKNYANKPEREDGKDYELPSEDDNPFVCFINPDQYGYEYEDECLDYYTGDDILVNETGEVVEEEEWQQMLGVEWKDRLEANDYESVYVRNSYLEKDYEIMTIHESYHKDEG